MTLDELLRQVVIKGPEDLADMWQPDSIRFLGSLFSRAVERNQGRYSLPEAVERSVAGIHAHGLLLGREHVRRGLLLPDTQRRSLAGLTLEDLGQIVCPNDLSGL